MTIILSKTCHFLLITGLFSFLALSVFGLGHLGGMQANKDGDMEGCIFTGKTMLCKMGIVEHISLWQSMFTVMPQESLMFIALLILLVTVIFVTKKILAPPRLSKSGASTDRPYLKEHPDLSLVNPLKEAFSQGILNPKIYDSAVI